MFLDEDNVFDSYIIQALTETENNTPLFDFYANNDGKDEPIYSEKCKSCLFKLKYVYIMI